MLCGRCVALLWNVLRSSVPALNLNLNLQGEGMPSGRGCRDNTESRREMPPRAADHIWESKAYQSRGIGARNAEQRDRGAGILGRGGIGAQAVDGGGARGGELLGGTEAGAGEASRHHRGIECEESLGGRVES